MAERRMGIIAFLFCLCLCLIPCRAQAASTADAKEAISLGKDCTLVLTYRCNATAVSDMPVKLYRIADVSADCRYTLTAPFDTTGLELNGIQSAREWNTIRTTLEADILANRTENAQCYEAVTDRQGQVCFEGLKPGLYLALNATAEGYAFESALIALPGLDADGRWQYLVSASPKGSETPPVEPDEEVEFKVLKLWKGDAGKDVRPEQIQIEIFRNGVSYATVILSKDNNWSYQWTAKADGANWNVIETIVPDGYKVTVEKQGNTFVLINTLIPDDTPEEDVPPADSPQTGDSKQAMMYSVLMYVSGIVLVILGITGKRKRS